MYTREQWYTLLSKCPCCEPLEKHKRPQIEAALAVQLKGSYVASHLDTEVAVVGDVGRVLGQELEVSAVSIPASAITSRSRMSRPCARVASWTSSKKGPCSAGVGAP